MSKENPEIVSSYLEMVSRSNLNNKLLSLQQLVEQSAPLKLMLWKLSKLPLLLSNNISLKKAQTVLDVNSDTAKMFGQPVKLFQTSSGHYCVNLLNNDRESHFRQTRFQEPKMWTHHFKHSCTLIRIKTNQSEVP